MILKAVKTIGRITLGVIVGLTLLNMVTLVAYPLYESTFEMDKSYPKQISEYTRPLKDAEGQRYCSSSSINYKGSVFTLTNNHCCDFGNGMFEKDVVRVGDSLEKVIYQSRIADVCVLTSSQKDTPLRLAKRELEILDEVLLLGYPRGDSLTPRYGHLIAVEQEICLQYDIGVQCIGANFISTITYPGNSGSPVFNEKGEVVNLLYAGNMYVLTYGITVPYYYVRAALEEALIAQHLR